MRTSPSVDDYIDGFPLPTQDVLRELRRRIGSLVPDGEESISYGVPTVKVAGRPVVYFAGFTKHVSLYPVTGTDEELERELAPYRGGRGTIRFPLAKPVPYDLVDRVVRFLRAKVGDAPA
jgi:uncharacterized protein YdhG (YjbR/CyaY superfamily)